MLSDTAATAEKNQNRNAMIGIVSITTILLFLYWILLRYTAKYIINYPVVKGVVQLGQSAVFSGTSAYLGTVYRKGIELGLKSGGQTFNTKVVVYSLDDGYNPILAQKNAHLFKEYYDVFAVIGTVGTPTSVQVADYLSQKKTPLIGPFSGSSSLRFPFNRYVVNLRPSYRNELTVIFQLFTKYNISNFAFFYQDDLFGTSVFNDMSAELPSYPHINLIGRGSYKRNDLWMEGAYSSILQVTHPHDMLEVQKSTTLKRLEAMILVSTASQAELCIAYFKTIKPDLMFVCISFVGTYTLGNLIAKSKVPYDKKYIYTTDVYPPGFNPKSQLDRMMMAQDPNVRFVSIIKEGFVTSLFFCQIIAILQAHGMDLTPSNFINCIYTYQRFVVAGVPIGPFYQGNNQGVSKVYVTRYDPRIKGFVQQE